MKYLWKLLFVVIILFSGCVKTDDQFYTPYTSEDHDGPQLEHPYMTDQFEMYVYEFMDNQLLEHMLYVYPETIIGELLEVKAEMTALDEPIEIVLS
jgi:hypothetical protein